MTIKNQHSSKFQRRSQRPRHPCDAFFGEYFLVILLILSLVNFWGPLVFESSLARQSVLYPGDPSFVYDKEELNSNSDNGTDVSSAIVDDKVEDLQKKVASLFPSTCDDSAPLPKNISSPYAYVWIIGGVHEDRPSYKGFVFDILISATVLRKAGSTADFWIFVRLSPDSKCETMTAEDVRLLNAVGIQIKYLGKPEKESFSQLVYDKFLTINMTDYKRVMFLDADILPLTNLDYYFHLSDPNYEEAPTVLKPNFIMATRGEPCNTGMFYVEPNESIFKQYNHAVETTIKKATLANLNKTKSERRPGDHLMDRKDGWGYNFRENGDQWEGIKKSGNLWLFHAAHSDQGQMYYVAKFLYKDVSIAIGRKVQNFRGLEGVKKPEMESEVYDLLHHHQPQLLAYQNNCDKDYVDKFTNWTCNPPYNSMAHFYGSTKPWQAGFAKRDLESRKGITRKSLAPFLLWWRELIELNEKLDMKLDIDKWNEKYLEIMKLSPLGYMAWYSETRNTGD